MKALRLSFLRFFILITLSLTTMLSCSKAHVQFRERTEANTPPALYLSWQGDPTSTMTVHWITKNTLTEDWVYYHKEGDTRTHQVKGSHHAFPDGDYLVHIAQLNNLDAESVYMFGFSKDAQAHKFRTMPRSLENSSREKIQFVVGGDCFHDENLMRATNRQAAAQSPDFVVIGGDIAYSSSKYGVTILEEDMQRWSTWLHCWSEDMITSDGRIIPIIPVIGNHEVMGSYRQTFEQAKGFYSIFAYPGKPGYNVLDFGDYLTILTLDSGHTNELMGAQSRWLEQTLSTRAHYPSRFVVYHVPAYPSARRFVYKRSVAMRENWVPIFEKYHVTTAFEHHDHAYKRSKLIKENRESEDGILYLGDGAWGVRLRTPHLEDKSWYIAKSASLNHFICVELDPKQRVYKAIDSEGQVFDQFVHPIKSLLLSEPSS